jgi:tetratricopeptide (TPR) repeat protein
MRILIFLLLIFMATMPAFSQVPSQKEMQQQMQLVIKELNKEIAELEKQIIEAKKNKEDDSMIKDLEDQLAMLKKQVAMMGGVTKGLTKMPDKVVKQAIEKDSIEQLRIVSVPKLDKQRIAMISKDTLNDAQMIAFVKNVHQEVERLIPKQEKEEASKIYERAKAAGKSSNTISNISSTLWASGQPEQAIYVMGKECVANPNDGNNLNNYAAFLTMAGGEHAAIPILQNLDNKYQGNSTIMNNIGQAWYALGDMNKAKFYLDKAIGTFEYHSEANQTKCWILKSEGKDKEAIEALRRSIQEVYTTEKDHLLNKLGEKLKFRDFRFPYPGKPGTAGQPVEQLGIDKFIKAIPDYPFEGGLVAEKAQQEWTDFRQKLSAALEIVDKTSLMLQPIVEAHNKALVADSRLLKPYNNHIHITAKAKLKAITEWFIDRILDLDKERKSIDDSISKWRIDFNKAMETLEHCGARKGAATTFVSNSNILNEQWNAKYLNVLKAYYNQLARLALYATTDRSEYLLLIESCKSGMLIALMNLSCVFEIGCLPTPPPQQQLAGALPDFDSLTCQYKDKIFIPPFTTITTECNIMTTEIELGSENLFEGFEIKLKGGMVENLNSGKITKGTIELGAEGGIDGNIGPIKGEVKGGVAAGIEITSAGVKEVYLKTTISAEWTGHIEEADPGFLDEPTIATKGTSIGEGEVKISWNAGPKGDWGFEHNTVSTSGSSNLASTTKGLSKIALKYLK